MALTAIHPGEHLAEELKEVGMSASELARRLDVPTNRVTAILNCQRAITVLALGPFLWHERRVLAKPPKFYELRQAKQKVGKSIRTLPTLKRTERVHA